MKAPLTSWVLTRACEPGGTRFAAMLPRLDRAVPCTRAGAERVRALCDDERWSARYVAGRALGRMAPEPIDAGEVWERLLRLAHDDSSFVREAVPFGIAALVERAPSAAQPLERLLTDAAAPRAERRAALRSLVLLAPAAATRDLGARLLRAAAMQDSGINCGVGAVILGRGIGARDPALARRIAQDWSESAEPALRRQGARALRGPLAEVS